MKIHVIDNSGLISPFLLLEQADIAFFGDEIQALNAVERQQPELILLDYALQGERTPEYIELLLSGCPKARLVIVGNELAERAVFPCLLAGAAGYQNRAGLKHYIDKMIRAVTGGEAWVSRRLLSSFLAAARQSHQFDTFALA